MYRKRDYKRIQKKIKENIWRRKLQESKMNWYPNKSKTRNNP